MLSKPPALGTARRSPRLRGLGSGLAAFALLVAALLGSTDPAHARGSSVKVLISTSVSEQALATMRPDLWLTFVNAYVGGNAIVFAGPGLPTVADCRKAGADYLVIAPFDLRPRLPGMANASGRVAAMTHLIARNCITDTISIDQQISFDSDPPSGASDGDFDSVAETTWAHAVPAGLAKHPLILETVAHVISVRVPFALVNIKNNGTIHPGDGLRDFSTPDHAPRAKPIIMTVTQVFDSYVEVTFPADATPDKGDLVEPIGKSSP